MNKTKRILRLIKNDGESVIGICKKLHIPNRTVTGILYGLEKRKRATKIEDRWFHTNPLYEKYKDLEPTGVTNSPTWWEGYASAMADSDSIAEEEFEEFLEFLRENQME